MKKWLKILIFIFALNLLAVSGVFITYFAVTATARLYPDKLLSSERAVEYYDKDGKLFGVSSKGVEIVKTEDVNPYTLNAFVAIEDKRFYEHDGVDVRAFFRAFFNNLKSFSFKEGGSTISQQLIKNTHLTNEKTLKRKMLEIKLAKELEKKYSKDEILEKYINTIYFGNGCYGISDACEFYFDKSPKDLSVNESAILAAIVRSPSVYSQKNNEEKCFERKNLVLKAMLKQKYITRDQYDAAIIEKVNLNVKYEIKGKNFKYYLSQEVENIIKNYPYSHKKLKVYTSFDPKLQEIIENNLFSDGISCDKTVAALDKDGLVLAYFSTVGEMERRLGSVIKPVLIYAPAIETGSVYACTKIKDEQTSIDGYTVTNFSDKYYGDVSVRFSLAKSLNSCAVKIFNGTGIKRCLDYAEKCGLNVSDEDANLSSALGNTLQGSTLLSTANAYRTFINEGNYGKYCFINLIIDENGKTVYKKSDVKSKVFSNATAEIMNDMLESVVKEGTAKALYSDIPLCAKTGTVGNENGNTDAYTMSYNPEIVLGVWYGNDDSAYMPNSVTGGNAPCKLSARIWKEYYSGKTAPDFKANTDSIKVFIDKEEYENGRIVLADENTPRRYTVKEIFKKTDLDKLRSTENYSPRVKSKSISSDKTGIILRLCLTKYADALIYRESNGKKTLIFDTYNNAIKNSAEIVVKDSAIENGKTYQYSVIPYRRLNDDIIYGEEVFFKKLKVEKQVPDFWWDI